MNGQIKKFELKKVLTSPIVWVLLVLFILFNGVIIFSNFYLRSHLNVLTSMVQQYGYEINEETLANWEQEHKRLLADANDASGYNFDSAMEFFDNGNTWILDEEIWEQFAEVRIIEHYLMTARDADTIYSKIDMVERGEELIYLYGLGGKAAEMIGTNYQIAQERLEELILDGEHQNFFFDGYEYKMHSFLFGTVLKILTLELILLVVLLTAFLLGYEFDSKTDSVTYATKYGRKLQLEKLKTAFISTTILATILIGVSLAMYFLVYDYSGLWNVPISSIFLSEFNQFLASAFSLSFLQYLLIIIGVILGILFLFILLSFVISMVLKNSYLVFVLFAIVFGGALLIPEMLSRNSQLFIYSAFTPFHLVLNLDRSLMMTGIANSFQYYEMLTLGIWGVSLLALSLFCYKRFKVRDL